MIIKIIPLFLIFWTFLDIIKPSFGFIHSIIRFIIYIQKKRNKLPDIKFTNEKVYGNPWFRGKWNFYDIELSIVNKYLDSDAINCQGKIVYKPRNKKEQCLKPMAWNVGNKVHSYNLEKGNPQWIHVFLFRKASGLSADHYGMCGFKPSTGYQNIIAPKFTEKFYDYIRVDIYCKEWKGYKTVKEWEDITVPDFFEKTLTDFDS